MENVKASMMQALKENNAEGFTEGMNQLMVCVAENVKQEYELQLQQVQASNDSAVLAQRGIRQLTTKEKEYYQKVIGAMQAVQPRQALENIDVVMPETILNAVFDDLQTAHPLLSSIGFVPTGGAIKMLMNKNGMQKAQWGTLCDEIVKEVLAGFQEVNTGLLKLSAFLPVCKSLLDLGPEWLDSFVRQVLYEALANGLEYGILKGDGNTTPIGAIRDVSDGVAVVNGAYPEKKQIQIADLRPKTIGNLLSLLAVDANGKPRAIRDIILIVNPQDYFQKIMPATTAMAPDGTYRNDILPYPIKIIQSAALDSNEAIIGMGYKYFAAAGMEKEGRIEYSDQYQFLEDNRVYLIKLYANGFPMDNNSFLYLDISGLQDLLFEVATRPAPTASTNANLIDLKIGNVTLSPTFATGTISYTATTKNTTNTITATPQDAGAEIQIEVKDTDGSDKKIIDNGSAVTWFDGSNTVTVTVTAADGTTTKDYTITVTKGE